MAKLRDAAAGIENVLIQAGACAVTLLPQFGGKIASIKVAERELLQTPLTPVAPRTRSMGFDKSDASGWDECLPSVAACRLKTDSRDLDIPDHGDLWRVEWRNLETENRKQRAENNHNTSCSVAFIGECFSLPLELERRFDLREEPGGWRILLHYTLRNTGAHSAPWSWAAHPLFAVEPGDRIVLPESIRSLRLEGSGGGRLGKRGETVSWPIARLFGGSTVDLSVAAGNDSGAGDKLFAGPLKASEGWCALERPSAGVRIKLKFDPIATAYLGLWICYGGWPERPGPKQVCVAMEPSTAPVDSLAVTGPWSRVLEPGDCFSWPMEVEIERIER